MNEGRDSATANRGIPVRGKDLRLSGYAIRRMEIMVTGIELAYGRIDDVKTGGDTRAALVSRLAGIALVIRDIAEHDNKRCSD